MKYKIDYMKEDELPATLDLVRSVFDEFNSEDYSQEGIDSFYEFINKDSVESCIEDKKMTILVARTEENKIIGMVCVSNGNHISLLFVDKKFHRKKIGSNLIKYVLKICQYNNKDIENITVNSSIYAENFYHNLGFSNLAELQEEDGIKFIPMSMKLVEKEDEENSDNEDIENNEDIYEILTEYYEEQDESIRLRNSRIGNLEFLTTTTYIDKYLCPNDRILEIGAGPGIYSNYYANQGYKVDAVELLDVNFEKLKECEKKGLAVHKANATDLSIFDDNTFDVTLCLGPLYHLFSEEEQENAIKEAIRVTKPCGKIFFAYITNESVMINYFLNEHHLIDRKDMLDEDFKVKNDPKEIFYVCTVEEFKNKMKNYNVNYLNNIATDGISSIIRNDIEYLDDDEFEEWIKYHLATCEREDLIGFSSHVLYICEKE